MSYEPLPLDEVTSPEQSHSPAKRASYRSIAAVAIALFAVVGFASYKIDQWSVIQQQPAAVLNTPSTADTPKPIPTGTADTMHNEGKYSVG